MAGALEMETDDDVEHTDVKEMNGASIAGDQAAADDEDVAEETEESPDDEDSIEARARALGWSTKDKWRGKPEMWKTAEEFLAFMDERPLVLKERAHKGASEIVSLKKQVEMLSKRVLDQDKRGYERALAEIRTGKKKAVAEGDTEAFERFEAQEDELRKAEPRDEPEPEPKAQDVPEPDDLRAWKSANKWFGPTGNRGMTQTAEGQYTAYFDAHPDETMEDEAARQRALRFVDRKMRAIFPEAFENPNRQSARTPNGVTAAKRTPAKTFADLPADAKAAADLLIRKKVYATREEYARDYFAQN